MGPVKKVLIVDDDRKTISIIRESLKGHRYLLQETNAAENALDIMEREEIDIVISGFRMPGMSGIEFLNELRGWDNDLPVILINEKGEEKDWIEAFRAHANAMISKPLKKETILKTVLKVLSDKTAPSAS